MSGEVSLVASTLGKLYTYLASLALQRVLLVLVLVVPMLLLTSGSVVRLDMTLCQLALIEFDDT